MDSSKKEENTPRRSQRLQRQHAVTPETRILGPRELMLLNKSKQNIDFNNSASNKKAKQTVEINIIPPTPVDKKSAKVKRASSKGNKKKSIQDNEELSVVEDQAIKEEKKEDEKTLENLNEAQKQQKDDEVIENDNTQQKDDKIEIIVQKDDDTFEIQPIAQKPNENAEEFHSATDEHVAENTETEMDKPKEEKVEQEIKEDDTFQKDKPKEEQEIKEDQKLNETPQLLDESIISVPESPPLTKSTVAVIKDSTFSPEVDTSIQDARPHIDKIFNAATPINPRYVTLRTSTPLSQKILSRDTPRLSVPVKNALSKILSPKIVEGKKLNEESLNETFNGQFKIINPLEKSILKSTRRKRSLSVADGESFMQKKVMFMSPEIMNIDKIDEKMLQSFKEEQENSILLKQTMTSGSGLGRKRSLSESGTPSKKRIKVPNFKAIHEQQFKKMESILDHQQRKTERAKRLATPSKVLSTVPESKENEKKHEMASKIPTRQPLKKVTSTQNLIKSMKPRPMKRSNSVDVQPSKASQLKETDKKAAAALPRVLSENSIPSKIQIFESRIKPAASSFVSSQTSMRAKVDERREKNISMYKGNAVKAGLDHRKRNETVLKGVRLNRRFELQMKHRRMEESED